MEDARNFILEFRPLTFRVRALNNSGSSKDIKSHLNQMHGSNRHAELSILTGNPAQRTSIPTAIKELIFFDEGPGRFRGRTACGWRGMQSLKYLTIG